MREFPFILFLVDFIGYVLNSCCFLIGILLIPFVFLDFPLYKLFSYFLLNSLLESCQRIAKINSTQGGSPVQQSSWQEGKSRRAEKY